MATIRCGDFSYTVDHAVKGPDYVNGYDTDGKIIVSFEGVTDFGGITYDGNYLTPESCLEESCNEVKYINGKLVNGEGQGISLATYTELTMLASGWSGNKYSFEDEYAGTASDLEISLSPNATASMVEAFSSATLAGSVDSNVVTALGDVPTIDILVIAKVVKK